MVVQIMPGGGSSGPSKPKGGGGGGPRPSGGGGGGGSSSGGSTYSPPSYDRPSGTQTLQPYKPPPGPSQEKVLEQIQSLQNQFTQNVSEWGEQFRGKKDTSSILDSIRSVEDVLAKDKPREAKLQQLEKQRDRTYKPRKTFEMSWEDYNALSDRQRAAVNYNTMLVDAREKDLEGVEPKSKRMGKRYDRSVDQLFGEEGGSDTYAPNTVAVLRQIDFDGVGQDLDDFLGLRTAITAKDLKNFDVPQINAATLPVVNSLMQGTPKEELGVVKQGIATSTEALEQKLIEGGQMIKNFQQSAQGALFNDPIDPQGIYLGLDMPNIKVPAGFRGGEQQKVFEQVFTNLASKELTGVVDEVWADAKRMFEPYGEFDKFRRYVDTRSTSEALYGLDFTSGQYRSPEEFRRLLNLDKEED